MCICVCVGAWITYGAIENREFFDSSISLSVWIDFYLESREREGEIEKNRFLFTAIPS